MNQNIFCKSFHVGFFFTQEVKQTKKIKRERGFLMQMIFVFWKNNASVIKSRFPIIIIIIKRVLLCNNNNNIVPFPSSSSIYIVVRHFIVEKKKICSDFTITIILTTMSPHFPIQNGKVYFVFIVSIRNFLGTWHICMSLRWRLWGNMRLV